MIYDRVNSASAGTEASSNEPCLLCGRDHYCYQFKDDREEIYKVICQWTDSFDSWHKVSIARDGRNVFVKDGHEQYKRRGKKYPEVINLNPQTKTIPQWQDVHIPVEQAEKGHIVRVKEGNPGAADTLYEIKDIKPWKPGHGLKVVLTVKDSPYGGKLELPYSELAEVVTYDPVTGAKEQFIEYFYCDNIVGLKVVRTQWTDRRPAYNGKTKDIRPYYLASDGKWVKGKGDRTWPLYRQSEAEETIKAGGIVFAVGGEEVVEYLRSLGLTATCNQGGEGGYRQIAQNLSESFKQSRKFQELLDLDAEGGAEVTVELKPLLVIWPDNDPTGHKAFGEGLPKECYKQGITSIVINPLKFWSDMGEGDDAKDWIEHCKASGISDDEMRRMLEFAVHQAIDDHEEELRLRWQREAWNAPTSHKGEIGRWVQSGNGENAKQEWKPLCNFDFQIECELKDSSGGGLVLQIKRSFDPHQCRIILNSKDYTKVDSFVDALKVQLGVGVVCNLSKFDLNALINTRLHEYRTNRQGQVFRRIERYGQQADGIWVFKDRQYTSDGRLTSEAETGWVFSDVSSEGDEIPCPELAPENPKALKNLLDAVRRFFGHENFYQVALMIGWVVAGLHSQAIFKDKRWFPLTNAHGEPGSCKTLAGEAALSLVGSNWPEKGMLARASVSAIYEHGSKTGALPFIWDDPARGNENEELAKTWANWKPRVVRKNRQEPHSPMGLTSNHVFGGDQAATYTRLVRLAFERAKGGDNASFQELQAAQSLASGAFPTLLKIGYPKEAIAAIERELLTHLPKAHARIAQALAIVVYYAQKVIELAEGTEDTKQWVIDNLCPTEDDADSAGDSLKDFIDKVLSLESESQVGDWNKQVVTTRDGNQWVAIHYADVWSLVDKHYKPATYNLKALKPLVIKAGGRVGSVQKFDASRDETLAYYRALINPRVDSEGNEYPVNPPRTVGRKAWLLPMSLFNSDGGGGDGDGGGDGNDGSIPPNPQSPLDGSSSQVTASYHELPKSGNSSNLDASSVLAPSSSQVTKLPKKEEENRIEAELAEREIGGDCHNRPSKNSVTPVTSVTQKETEAGTQQASQFQRVTDFGNLPVTASVTSDSGSSQPEPAPINETERNGTVSAIAPDRCQQSPPPTSSSSAAQPDQGGVSPAIAPKLGNTVNLPEGLGVGVVTMCYPDGRYGVEHGQPVGSKFDAFEASELTVISASPSQPTSKAATQKAPDQGPPLAPGARVRMGYHHGTLASQTPDGRWFIQWDKQSNSQLKQYGQLPVGAIAASQIELIEVEDER